MFKIIAAALSGRTTAAPKPAPELESVPAFEAHLLAKGLSKAEAGEVMVARYCAMRRYWLAKGYTHDQHAEMPISQQLTIPTREADAKLYWQCYREYRVMARRVSLWRDFTPS